jgi:hypothetical protein
LTILQNVGTKNIFNPFLFFQNLKTQKTTSL